MSRSVLRSVLALTALSILVAPTSAQDPRLTEQVDRWLAASEQLAGWQRDGLDRLETPLEAELIGPLHDVEKRIIEALDD